MNGGCAPFGMHRKSLVFFFLGFQEGDITLEVFYVSPEDDSDEEAQDNNQSLR